MFPTSMKIQVNIIGKYSFFLEFDTETDGGKHVKVETSVVFRL